MVSGYAHFQRCTGVSMTGFDINMAVTRCCNLERLMSVIVVGCASSYWHFVAADHVRVIVAVVALQQASRVRSFDLAGLVMFFSLSITVKVA